MESDEISDLKYKVDTVKIENIDLRREKERMSNTVIDLQVHHAERNTPINADVD